MVLHKSGRLEVSPRSQYPRTKERVGASSERALINGIMQALTAPRRDGPTREYWACGCCARDECHWNPIGRSGRGAECESRGAGV